MITAGLDVSSNNIGWSINIDGKYSCGTFSSKSVLIAERGYHYQQWLFHFLCGNHDGVRRGPKIQKLAMEEPLPSNRMRREVSEGGMFDNKIVERFKPMTSMASLRGAYGFAFVTMVTAHIARVPMMEINVQKWRHDFLGFRTKNTDDFGRPFKDKGARTEYYKAKAIARCEQLGLTPDTHDAAEAVGVNFCLDGLIQKEALSRRVATAKEKAEALFSSPG
ncbi:hypothetical protein [Roseibium sp. Sym1]|uniref:hypothetical protein n=1 Tax=Roseibium sp. Sym1 TaxID=3016006 RepID=UPI0022B58B0F|nr:hypothetical protein [Roseibium sp. Sym1]